MKRKLKKLKIKIPLQKRLKIEEQKIILNNIYVIMKQGYSLNECIKLLSSKMNLEVVLNNLQNGEKFTKALKLLKFDNDVLLILQISEDSGQILDGIKKSINIIDQKMKIKNSIIERMKYPLILGVVLIVAIFFITKLLFPMFLNVYQNFGIEMNIGIKIFVLFLNLLPKIIIILIICLFFINFYMKLQEQSDILKIIMKNKFIKKQYYKMYNQVFLLNLSSLLELGFRLDEIFLIFSNQKYNYFLKIQSNKIYKKLLTGEEFPKILEQEKIYNKSIIIAIEEGLKYNTLVQNLRNEIIIKEVQTKKKTERYLFLIQPLFYLFFGIIIILLYACIFVPMFKIMESI